jgi:hypothetical protein
MDVNPQAFVESKKLDERKKEKKELTSEMKIDNLEEFAKTSLAAEVILDRPIQESKTRPQRSRTRDLSK